MRKAVALLWVVLLMSTMVAGPKVAKAEDTNWWVKNYGEFFFYTVTVAPDGDIIVAGSTKSFGAGYRDVWVLRLDENGNIKWQKTYGGSDFDEAHAVALAPNGDIIIAGWTSSFGAGYEDDFWVLRLPPDGNLPGCEFCKDSNAQVSDTNAYVTESNAQASETNAQVQNSNAEIHDTNVQPETLWTYTPSSETTTTQTSTYTSQNLPRVTSKLVNTGTIEVPGFKPSSEYQKETAAYAIQKAEELINYLKEQGYEVNFADDYLREAKKAFDAGDYAKAKELALKAWIIALEEWQIQYEAEILEKAGVNVSDIMEKYHNGDLEGALELVNEKKDNLSDEYSSLFTSVRSTFETIKDYWDEGIRLWNYVDDLKASNEKFKSGEVDVAKNLADKALNVVRDIGEMARDVLRQLKELGDSIFNEGRGGKDAQELFERAMSAFERGEFEEVKKVIVEIQEVVVTETKKGGGICGPGLIIGLSLVALLRRRR